MDQSKTFSTSTFIKEIQKLRVRVHAALLCVIDNHLPDVYLDVTIHLLRIDTCVYVYFFVLNIIYKCTLSCHKSHVIMTHG